MGCQKEALEILDRFCSGRHECAVRVLDDTFEGIKPCHADLKSYLEAAYSCVSGKCIIILLVI